VVVIKEGVTKAHHQSSDTTPVKATGPSSKIQCEASIQLISNVKAQQALVLWMNEDSPVSFGDVQGQLDQLVL
jgi:hypothetical protein